MNTAMTALRQRVRSQWIDPHWLEFAVGHVVPLWSAQRTKARLIARFRETPDVTSFVFQPNGRWRGFRAGQFVSLRVPVDGIWHERCYSLTGDPAAATVQISVRRQAGGRVSTWLHDRLQPGDIIELGAAAGDFVLPSQVPDRMLLIAAGIGITPVLSVLRAALETQPALDAILLYYARSPRHAAFLGTLNEWRSRHLGLRVHMVYSDAAVQRIPTLTGHFSAAHLNAVAPDAAQREAWVCGPAAMTDAVAALATCQGWAARLRRERFAAAVDTAAAVAAAPVTYARSGRTVAATAPTLLAAAEAAGLRPAYGCRMGICNTCRCLKHSGTVRHIHTGMCDDTPNSDVRLCVSAPVGPVTLDL